MHRFATIGGKGRREERGDGPTAEEALKRLEPLVGEWTLEAKPPDGPPWPGEARATIEWHDSGAHLVQRSTVHLPEALKRVLERWVSEDRDLRAAATITAASDGSIGEDGEEGLLNRRVLATLRELQQEGEPDLLDELIELFLADPRLTALRAAVEAGDAHSVERSAHALKGSCANMGAVGMVALCTELVETGRSGQLLIAPTLSSRLEEEFEQVRAVIEKELSKN